MAEANGIIYIFGSSFYDGGGDPESVLWAFDTS